MDDKSAGHSSISISACNDGSATFLMISSTRHLRLLRSLQPPKLESIPLLKRILLDLQGNFERNPSHYEQDANVNDIGLPFSIQSNLFLSFSQHCSIILWLSLLLKLTYSHRAENVQGVDLSLHCLNISSLDLHFRAGGMQIRRCTAQGNGSPFCLKHKHDSWVLAKMHTFSADDATNTPALSEV